MHAVPVKTSQLIALRCINLIRILVPLNNAFFVFKYLFSKTMQLTFNINLCGGKPQKTVLKVNCIVLLTRNLNTKEALVNGTRMLIKFMHRNAINCEVLTGAVRNKRI